MSMHVHKYGRFLRGIYLDVVLGVVTCLVGISSWSRLELLDIQPYQQCCVSWSTPLLCTGPQEAQNSHSVFKLSTAVKSVSYKFARFPPRSQLKFLTKTSHTVLPANQSGHFWVFCYYLMFFHIKLIMEAFVLKLGQNVGTSFIFLLANFGRSSLNAYVVITTK